MIEPAEAEYPPISDQVLSIDVTSIPTMVEAPAPAPIRKLWAKKGLDLSDSTILKAWQSETKYDSSVTPPFNLESSLFPAWCQVLQDKSDRCCLSSIKNIETVAATDGVPATTLDIFRQYSLLTKEQIKATSDDIFATLDGTATADDKTAQSDKIIKLDMLGEYIHNSLSASAKTKFANDRSDFKRVFEGETFFDGIYYFWLIANHVNPDNDHIVTSLKAKIRALHVKNFGWSIISLLTEFSRLKDEITQLSGAYNDSDALYDFWQAVSTMPEEEFSGFVKRAQDSYREEPIASRSSLDSLISKMKAKQTAMETDGTWNKLSATQAQILALAMQTNSSSATNNTNQGSQKQQKKLTPEFRQSLLCPPAEGASTTKTFSDGKERHYCGKCNGGQGRWVFHEEKDHSEKHDKAYEQWKARQDKATSTTNSSDTSTQKKKKKKNKKSNAKPTLAIDKKYLEALKGGSSSSSSAFFSQFIPDSQLKD